ncbi:putative DEAD/DEAH box helicase [Acidithiobacillus ferrivorans]|uniref:DEAD/DEAH box helicase n=1 Tax=Acidithiobacillus ferrivorans TaxID=160808 RepID=A0A060URV6_9PROT|nr:DEAD/DEAH box helicase [Acidithiobacillus ferrivorans]CDQ09488.1 DEAD/DEAH box helicase domain protein [Acidithiobacillus ferrivorans]SMH67264.1 putative DEAD/DEAH box helicase [Acidithiobacillus ferrivorans]
MSHWMLESLGEMRGKALHEAARAQVLSELASLPHEMDYALIERVAQAMETLVMDLLLSPSTEEEQLHTLRQCAAEAYRLYRVLPEQKTTLGEAELRLRQSALAVLGDLGADAARNLRERQWPALELESEDWRTRTLSTIIDIWLRLIRKQGWDDRDAVLERIKMLRQAQEAFELSYFESLEGHGVKAAALELMVLYHLAKAAEILALYVTDGVVEGSFQINNLLDMHFDRAMAVCERGTVFQLEPLTRLLAATARQLADNAMWTVTRAVNSRVTKFVSSLVDRGRGDKALFDVLPPQRRALAEQGLLGSSRRAVVVSLPTSSGKTLIAQFRILQALNQFDHERGWVAYLAPTRTLVRQVARRLRHDFEPLGVLVEQVSPALEVDGVEAELLREKGENREFRILVTTPEKLDLMLRQDWEEKIGRPLTLVVVDEAHNIQEGARGLKLELLLATINVECRMAQFLLLTPFISNAREVARWLGDTSSDDISLAMDWQPNDRVIGVVAPVKGPLLKGKSYDYQLNLETVHTTRATLAIDELIPLRKDPNCNKTFSQISKQSEVAVATAQQLKSRGPVIVMHARPDWVLSLATMLKSDANRRPVLSEQVKLVQEFLALEMGQDFPLIDLLAYGVGVHHAGLSDDTRALMEWLFENEKLDFLVATTTIAQGVNFPVSGVVMASHQYPSKTGTNDMPSADFWNIAGRAGRVDQSSVGVVALAAADDAKASKLREFIHKQTGELNSALIRLVTDAGDFLDNLELIVYQKPEWSAFVQYLAHTYRQMGQPQAFADQIEQVLRGTFGFGKLRASNPNQANRLLNSIRTYADYLSQPRQPLKLVDSTGFSLQSIKTAMIAAGQEGIGKDAWNAQTLFGRESDTLEKMMGVLLKVPELRDNLAEVTGNEGPNGDKLALIIKDWVSGCSLPDIAQRHFSKEGRDATDALTACGQNLFGKLTQTAAWGLGALLSITGGDIPEDERQMLNNLASRVYYGVSDENAIALRLLGIPRMAAEPLASHMLSAGHHSLSEVRDVLRSSDAAFWTDALGTDRGQVYRKVWRVLEGLD